MKSTFNMTAKETEHELKSREHPPLGTVWVAPGEGSTWKELMFAFHTSKGLPRVLKKEWRLWVDDDSPANTGPPPESLNARTNLRLTGEPIRPYDRQRWESGDVE